MVMATTSSTATAAPTRPSSARVTTPSSGIPGDGSDVVEGGTGSDNIVFNGSGGNEIMAATANFGRVSFTRNLGSIVMDLNGVEAIDVNALGGTDSITVNDIAGTDLRRVNVDLAGALGGSAGDGAGRHGDR